MLCLLISSPTDRYLDCYHVFSILKMLQGISPFVSHRWRDKLHVSLEGGSLGCRGYLLFKDTIPIYPPISSNIPVEMSAHLISVKKCYGISLSVICMSLPPSFLSPWYFSKPWPNLVFLILIVPVSLVFHTLARKSAVKTMGFCPLDLVPILDPPSFCCITSDKFPSLYCTMGFLVEKKRSRHLTHQTLRGRSIFLRISCVSRGHE
jgi:hypothetical protein